MFMYLDFTSHWMLKISLVPATIASLITHVA